MSRGRSEADELTGAESSLEFPPRPSHPDEIDILVEVLASLVEGRGAFYVSSPLTTGQRAFEWHLGGEGISKPRARLIDDSFRREVIEPNREEAAGFARDLRRRTRRVVIDPTALRDLPDWIQADYQVLWARVIERYVEAVVFRDGWQFSSGCAYEFLAAHATGARLLREDLSRLSVEEAHALLAKAIDESRARGVTAHFLRRVLTAVGAAVATSSDS
jgi:hypothetical protein